MARDSVVLDTKKLDSIIRNEPQRVELWLDGEAEYVTGDIKLSMGISPSSPGEPPGVDTGALRASMHWERSGPMERTISDGVLYGLPLEEGTETIAPRPFVAPAFARLRQTIGESAKRNLNIEDL